jgi:TPP-dependent pyruvate/acetoin dehydrogenase alpha subunit
VATGREEDYRAIATIRVFEERCMSLKTAGEIPGSIHLCDGQEAIPVGACRAIEPRDAVTVTYRGHGWAIARGLPLVALFAELMGRDSELNGGRAGSPFFSSPAHGFLGENSIVAGGMPMGVGAALAAAHDGSGAVSIVSVGDGALNQGAAHEALNFASVFSLPLVLVVENNRYSEMTPIRDMVRVERLADRAAAYGMPGVTIDGNDATIVEATVLHAVARARAGGGPTLIEADTERLVGHYSGDLQAYRPSGEIAAARQREPLARIRRAAAEEGSGAVARLDAIDLEVSALIDAAVEGARAVPYPDPTTVREHLYA